MVFKKQRYNPRRSNSKGTTVRTIAEHTSGASSSQSEREMHPEDPDTTTPMATHCFPRNPALSGQHRITDTNPHSGMSYSTRFDGVRCMNTGKSFWNRRQPVVLADVTIPETAKSSTDLSCGDHCSHTSGKNTASAATSPTDITEALASPGALKSSTTRRYDHPSSGTNVTTDLICQAHASPESPKSSTAQPFDDLSYSPAAVLGLETAGYPEIPKSSATRRYDDAAFAPVSGQIMATVPVSETRAFPDTARATPVGHNESTEDASLLLGSPQPAASQQKSVFVASGAQLGTRDFDYLPGFNLTSTVLDSSRGSPRPHPGTNHNCTPQTRPETESTCDSSLLTPTLVSCDSDSESANLTSDVSVRPAESGNLVEIPVRIPRTSRTPRRQDCSAQCPSPNSKKRLVDMMGLYRAESVEFIAKAIRRKRRASSSTQKRKRRAFSTSLSLAQTARCLQHKKARYQASPGLANRTIQRVYEMSLYRCSRKSVYQRASQAVKAKYHLHSPFRRETGSRALARYRTIRQSNEALTKLRNQQLASRRKKYNSLRVSRNLKEKGACQRRRNAELKQINREKKHRELSLTQVEMRFSEDPLLKTLINRKQSLQSKSTAPLMPSVGKNTAEYRKLKFKGWERYKINQLFSQYRRTHQADSERKAKKYEAARVFHQTLNIQRTNRTILYNRCMKITTLHQLADEKAKHEPNSNEMDVLSKFYGKSQYHVPGRELHPSSSYCTYLELFPDEKDTCSRKQKLQRVRPCDETCDSEIRRDWPLLLHRTLAKFRGNQKIQNLLQAIYSSEKCGKCDSSEEGLCASVDSCDDIIRVLLHTSVHFVGLRSLLRDMYRIRKVALQLHLIELLLFAGTYNDFVQFCKQNSEETNSLPVADQCEDGTVEEASDECVISRFASVISNFEESVKNSMEIHRCCNCLWLVERCKIRIFPRVGFFCAKYKDTKAIAQNYEKHYGGLGDHVSLCKTCVARLKKKKLSKFSYLNSMWPSPIPPSLKRLNVYERQLISLSKSFQRIVKLKPYSYRGPDATLTRGIKGFAVHLPLPGGTVEKVSNTIKNGVTLPDCSKFLIQVDSLPNLTKMLVFRSLVDISSVMEALRCLTRTNPLYANVQADESFILLRDEEKLPQIVREDCDMEEGADNDIEPTEMESTHVESRRKAAKRRPSFFEPITGSCENSDHPISAAAPDSTAHSAECHADEVCDNQANSVTCRGAASTSLDESGSTELVPQDTVCQGRMASKDIIAGLNFPIQYLIPYPGVMLSELKQKSSMLMHLQESSVLEEFSIVQMEKSLPNVSDTDTFAMKPVSAAPLFWDDPLVDVASFAHLYPDGRNGVFEQRPEMVTKAFFIEHRFRMSDPRFRRDLFYLFDCAIRKDMMALNSSVYTMLKSGKFGRVTVRELKSAGATPEKSKTLERNVCTMLRQIGGTPQYWRSVKLDLDAVIEQYGPPTWFFTASCAEYRQEDFREFLILRNTDVPNIRNTSIRNLISLDPISVALHFHKKFNCFWDEVIMNDTNPPLGHVERFYIRKEYQQRGAPHMHVLLWVKDAPVHGRDSDEDVLKFVSSHISCSIPDPVTSPRLHELVTLNQVHKCTKSCMRSKSVKGVHYASYCRYGFPRQVTEEGRIYSVEEVLGAKVTGQNRKKLYDLPRKENEMWINDYNPAVLFMWAANIDIQFVNDSKQALVFYTTGYVTKSEKQAMSKVANSLNNSLSAAGIARQMACKLMSSRQMGAYEAADKVLRHPLYRLSEEVKTAAMYFPGEECRRLKTQKQLDALPPDSTDVFCNNMGSSYYPGRPAELERYCMFELMRCYDVKYGRPPKSCKLHMPALNAYFSKRRRQAVVRIYKPRDNDPQNRERYCFLIVALFKPWRCTEELLRDMDGKMCETYTQVYDRVRDVLPNMQEFESSRERLAAMVEWADHIRLEAQRQLEAQVESGVLQEVEDSAKYSVQELDLELCKQSDLVRNNLTESGVNLMYQALNSVQRESFDLVIEHKAANPEDRSRLTKKVFVSGVGGTGKSFVIRALRNHVEFHYSSDKGPAVLVAAPTGVAAANIDGVTIHKLLKLPVSKAKKLAPYISHCIPKTGRFCECCSVT